MFRNARVGDRVYSVVYGWGKIIDARYEKDIAWPFHAKFGKSTFLYFNMKGKANDQSVNPTIFLNTVKVVVDEGKPSFPWEDSSLREEVIIGKGFKLNEIENTKLSYVLNHIFSEKVTQADFFHDAVMTMVEKLINKDSE